MNNLSRFPQPVELDLRRFEGVAPIELLGGVRFPEIGELPYLLTLGAYGFYWFRLPSPDDTAPAVGTDGARAPMSPTTREGRARAVPRDRPLVRRQGPRARPSSSVTPGRHRSAAASRGRAAPVVRHRAGHRRRTPTEPQEPRPTRCRWPTTPSRRSASSTRSSAPGTTTSSAPVHAYDAVHDREADRAVAGGLRRAGRRGPTERRRPDLPPAARATTSTWTRHSTLFSGEQSNSSLLFGEDA